MSKYNDTVLTTAGLDLVTRAGEGQTSFKITKAESTADDLSATDLSALTAIPHVVQTGSIVGSDAATTGVMGIKIQFNNTHLSKSYIANAVGVYATETGGKEVLYAVTTAETGHAQYMPDFAGGVKLDFGIVINVVIGKASSVTVQFDTDGLATIGFVQDAVAGLKNVAKTDEANTFSKSQTLAGGAVNGAGKKALFDGDVDVPSDVVRADMLKPNLIDVATDEWQTLTNVWNGGWLPFNVVSGQRYSVSADIDSKTDNNDQAFVTVINGNPNVSGSTKVTTGAYVVQGTVGTSEVSFTATTTATYWIGISLKTNTGSVRYRYLVATQSNSAIDYPTAQYNRHAYAIDKEQDTIGTRNYIKNSATPLAINGDAEHFKVVFSPLTAGETYTFESDVVVTKGSALTKIGMGIYNEDNSGTSPYWIDHPTIINGHIRTTFTVPDGGVNLLVYAGEGEYASTTGHAITLTNYHLNSGVAKTDWSPAPEDLQKSLTIPDGESKYIWKGTSSDFTQSLLSLPAGVTTFYADGAVANNPAKVSVRGYAHITTIDSTGSLGIGWLISNNGDMWEFFISGKSVKYTQLASKAYVDQKMQTAVDQIQPLIDADDKKHNLPTYFWSGTADEYAAVTPKVADADYSVFE